MAAEWYYRASTGRPEGPVTAAHLKQLVQLGEIGPETEIKKGAEGRWITANKVKGLLDTPSPTPTTAKTAPAPWCQQENPNGDSEQAPHRPKSPAPLVRRPPVDAEPDEDDDRPVPARRTARSDVVDAESTVASPTKQRSPFLLVGAGAGGLVVVGIVMAVVLFGRSGDKGSGPGPSGVSDQQKQAQLAEEQRRKADQERAATEETERAAKIEAEKNEKAVEQQKYEAWLKSGQEIGQFVGSEDSWFGGVSYSNGIVFSPRGRYVAAASNSKKFSPLLTMNDPNPDFGDTAVYVWDTQRREVVRRFAPKPYKPDIYTDYRSINHAFTSVAFSADERLLAAGREDGSVRVWDVSTGNEVAMFLTPAVKAGKASEKVHSVAFSPDGGHVLATGVAYNGGEVTHPVRLWSVADGQVAVTFTGHSNIVISSAFSPNGRYAVTGSWDRTAIVWDVKAGKEFRLLDAHAKWVTAVAFSPDGSKVLTGGDDQTVRLWDVSSGRQLFHVNVGNAANSVTFRAGGKHALVGTSMRPDAYLGSPIDSNPVMIDLDKGAVAKLPVAFMKTPLESVHAAVSPDGKLVVFNAKQRARIRGRDVETNYLTLRELPE